MFKKKCTKCNRKIDRKFDFCPYCGKNLNKHRNEDYGFLGKDDSPFESNPPIGFGGSILDKFINRAMKELPSIMKSMEQQMNDEFNNKNNSPNFPKSNMNIKFMVNGKEIPLNQNPPKQKTIPEKIKKQIGPEKAKQIAKLPRSEPKVSMKRLSEKIIYEFEVPGVENIEDVLVNQLENSIEIKAFSKNKVYSKNLNINLPVLKYSLSNGNLILELQAE